MSVKCVVFELMIFQIATISSTVARAFPEGNNYHFKIEK